MRDMYGSVVVQFVKPYRGYAMGEQAGWTPEFARLLVIDLGVAVYVVTPAEVTAAAMTDAPANRAMKPPRGRGAK